MSVPADRAPHRTGSRIDRTRGYPWSWVCVVGLVGVIYIVAGRFAADAWLDDSLEWMYQTWALVAVWLFIGAPLVALGFVGRLAFGKVRHLARTGSLAWALTFGLVNGLVAAVSGDSTGAVVFASAVTVTFLVAWVSMSVGAFAAAILCGRKVR